MAGVPLTMLDEAAERFRLLSDPTRLRLLNELDLSEEVSVGDVAERAGVGLSNTSKHLHQLERAGRRRHRTEIPMPREFHFPASITWEGGRRTSARVEGKQAIGIAPPPEFR